MKLTGNYDADFALLTDTTQEPFAVTRFADGEAALLRHQQIMTADGWTVPKEETRFTQLLREALEYDDERMVFGLSSDQGEMAKEVRDYLVSVCKAPPERITTSNIFVNANWNKLCVKAARENWFSNFTLVISDNEEVKRVAKERLPHTDNIIHVPQNAVNYHGIDTIVLDTVYRLFESKHPILLMAGPLSNILIHRYWECAKQRRICIDVGSAFDPFFRGCVTRGYHRWNAPTRNQRG